MKDGFARKGNYSVTTITIYHNPRCSKSRATLALIRDNGCQLQIIEYLSHAFSRDELYDILKKLNMLPRDILRSADPLYEELNLHNNLLADDQIVDLIIEFPKLLERPIVVSDFSAIIGRPPENVFNLL